MSLVWKPHRTWPNTLGAVGNHWVYYLGVDLRPKTGSPDRPIALYRKPRDRNRAWRVLDSFATVAEAQARAELAERAEAAKAELRSKMAAAILGEYRAP